ncbi:unnamed protein product [Discosporangium mesarthrocarpum]
MADEKGVQISFDDEYRVRVLDPEQFKHSEALEEECRGFVNKIRDFNSQVHNIVEVLEANAKRIEKEKLRAIGQRNKVDGELEYRLRQKSALQTLLKEKMLELDRQNLQYQSLLRVESEQLALIEKLSNSEAVGEQEAPHK